MFKFGMCNRLRVNDIEWRCHHIRGCGKWTALKHKVANIWIMEMVSDRFGDFHWYWTSIKSNFCPTHKDSMQNRSTCGFSVFIITTWRRYYASKNIRVHNNYSSILDTAAKPICYIILLFGHIHCQCQRFDPINSTSDLKIDFQYK